MSDHSKIEWTDASWNPIRGCTRVSPGCGGPNHEGGCYAEQIAARFSDPGQPFHGFAERTPHGGRWTGKLALIEDMLTVPLKWKKPRRIFVNSMSDLFHESLPDEAIDKVFAVMACAGNHTYQVLTKRAERMKNYVSNLTRERIQKQACGLSRCVQFEGRWLFDLPLANLWLGVSAERQQEADERVPHLLATPAAVRFISCEPLLGAIDLEPWLAWPERAPDVNDKSWGCQECDSACDCPRGKAVYVESEGPPDAEGTPTWITADRQTLDWIIVGGESGRHARPMHPDWARSLRDQCAAAGVSFFFKQWGEWADTEDWPSEMQEHLELAGKANGNNVRVGKKAAGRLLDGREHNEFPFGPNDDRTDLSP